MTKKEPNPEEFMRLMIDCYEAFKEVMKTGTPTEKQVAVKTFQSLHRMFKEQLEEFEDRKGVKMKDIGQLLRKSNKGIGQVCEEANEQLVQLSKEIQELLPKPPEKTDKEKLAEKKKQKRRMEKKLRSKL